MTQEEKELIDKCIEAHYNMIKHHRKAILELERKKFKERDWCDECFDLEIINEKKR